MPKIGVLVAMIAEGPPWVTIRVKITITSTATTIAAGTVTTAGKVTEVGKVTGAGGRWTEGTALTVALIARALAIGKRVKGSRRNTVTVSTWSMTGAPIGYRPRRADTSGWGLAGITSWSPFRPA
jgi:hypothetical protein